MRNLLRAVWAPAAALAVVSCATLPEGRAPVDYLRLGSLKTEKPAAAQAQLEAAIAALGRSPEARRLAAAWGRASGPGAGVITVEVERLSAGGSASRDGVVVLDPGALPEPRYAAMVLAHEWLGHKLGDLSLEAVLGRAAPAGLSTELLSRVRGWRVWLELDAPAALKNDELKRFIALGPEAYRRWMVQPGRTYALSMTLAEMREPEKVLRERLAAIREMERREASEAGKDSSDYGEWRRALGGAPARAKPRAAPDVYARHQDPDLSRHLRLETMKLTGSLAEGLLTDQAFLERQKKAAADPALQALAADWDKEIAAFHVWANSLHSGGRR